LLSSDNTKNVKTIQNSPAFIQQARDIRTFLTLPYPFIFPIIRPELLKFRIPTLGYRITKIRSPVKAKAAAAILTLV